MTLHLQTISSTWLSGEGTGTVTEGVQQRVSIFAYVYISYSCRIDVNQAAQQLHARLAAIRRRWLLVQSAAGTLALGVSVLLAAALLDNLLKSDE